MNPVIELRSVTGISSGAKPSPHGLRRWTADHALAIAIVGCAVFWAAIAATAYNFF
ncbi:MAG: hypothetical protein KGJ78_01810 [Alphaproteobacteria bacterium]|nr:hypothetical protein [Alphaproteobacteria bacterium]